MDEDGLRLSICQEILKKLNGSITFQLQDRMKAVFTATILADKQAALSRESERASSGSNPDQTPDLRPKNRSQSGPVVLG